MDPGESLVAVSQALRRHVKWLHVVVSFACPCIHGACVKVGFDCGRMEGTRWGMCVGPLHSRRLLCGRRAKRRAAPFGYRTAMRAARQRGTWTPPRGRLCTPPICARQVTGVLVVESYERGEWRRVIFAAEPLPDPEALAQEAAEMGPLPRYRVKSLPDCESSGACWVSAVELEAPKAGRAAGQRSRCPLPLRSASEPLTWIPHVAAGGAVQPLEPPPAELLRVLPDVPLI